MKNHIARVLRKNQTPQEIKLWSLLKNKKLAGLKFRRQHKIDKYIVDFCCLEKKLIIELDGGQHNEEKNIIKDKQRDKFLHDQGYVVLRIWNNEVNENMEGVVDKMLESCNIK